MFSFFLFEIGVSTITKKSADAMNLSTALDKVKNKKENAFEKLLKRVSTSHKFHVKTAKKNCVCLTFKNGNKFYLHGGHLFGFFYGRQVSGFLRVVKITDGNITA